MSVCCGELGCSGGRTYLVAGRVTKLGVGIHHRLRGVVVTINWIKIRCEDVCARLTHIELYYYVCVSLAGRAIADCTRFDVHASTTVVTTKKRVFLRTRTGGRSSVCSVLQLLGSVVGTKIRSSHGQRLHLLVETPQHGTQGGGSW